MVLTNFPDGITSFGVPVVGGGTGPFKPYATYYFVDADNITQSASDGNPGLSPEEPLSTMARAFALVKSGDVITFIGNVREQISAPLGVFDVTIIGAGNSPRHADEHTGLGGYSGATWRPASTPVAATPLLTIQSQGWQCVNFLFTSAPANTAGCLVARNSSSGDDEIDGGHCQFIGMRFDACPIGLSVATTGFVQVYNSFFRGCTTAGINAVAGGPGTNGFWNIEGNRFYDNEVHIDVPLVQSTIQNNVSALFTTLGFDLTGGANNVVTKNTMSGDYATEYVAGTSDVWFGNFADATDNDVGDNGITTAAPGTTP